MQQLPLEVRLDDHAVFDTFFAGPNDACVHALRELARTSVQSSAWLWGAPGSGRSHLLQACVAAGDAAGTRSAYLPLGPDAGLSPRAFDGLDACGLVCVDDVDCVAGRDDWERGLLMLYEGLRQRGARLVMSAERAPLHCQFALPDLVSRFASAATFRLRGLDDDHRIRAMQLRASWRGLELSDEVAAYILSRVERGTVSLFRLLDRLDREALAAQRRLSIPFVREVLGRA